MTYEGLEGLSHFIGRDFIHYHFNSVLKGKGTIKKRGIGEKNRNGIGVKHLDILPTGVR